MIRFELINNTAPLISYTVKLVDDSTYLTKTLEVANNLSDNLAKVYDRKNVTFMQYGNEWLVHKFNITKPHFEKIVKKIVLKFFTNLSMMKYYILIKINFHALLFIIEQAFVRQTLDEYHEHFKFS